MVQLLNFAGKIGASPKELEHQHGNNTRHPQHQSYQNGEKIQGKGHPGGKTGEVHRPQGGKAHGRRGDGGAYRPAHPNQQHQQKKAQYQKPRQFGGGCYPMVSTTSLAPSGKGRASRPESSGMGMPSSSSRS